MPPWLPGWRIGVGPVTMHGMGILAADAFTAIDWLIVIGYLAAVVAVGLWASRGSGAADAFFLASRRMPMWAVAISLLATSQSAATFVGGPQQAYAGDLTYLSANLGALVAVVIVAVFFVPAYYRQGVTSVYELIGHRYGTVSQQCASAMFMLGRIFASGARLYIVAIPFSLIAFGDISSGSMIASILLIAAVAAAYTVVGGIRAVIWTDVMQAAVYVGTIIIVLGVLWQKIPLGIGELIGALREGGDAEKLKVLDLSTDLSRPFTLWAVLVGLTLFNVAAYGTDQDLTQRLLTCKSARAGSWSVIVSNLIGWPVILLFLLTGLLLYVYLQRPDIMGAASPGFEVEDSRRVFIEFILHEMPAGLRGLMLAGLFAAAMSSLDSALNAMASTTVADFYRPWSGWHGSAKLTREDGSDSTSQQVDPCHPSDRRELLVSRMAIGVWAVCLAGFAIFCVYWQQRAPETLITFALNVMVFAYSGLLAVFSTALFTRRGNVVSVTAALATGFVCVLLLEDFAWAWWIPKLGLEDLHLFDVRLGDLRLAFAWKMVVATTLSFAVCCAGRRTKTRRATEDAEGR